MNFSLVFATRGRVDLLEGLFRSLAETTASPSSVEVIPVIDDDDIETHESINRLIEMLPNFHVQFRSRPRSKMLNEDYINWGARNSNGSYIFILNDDVVFKTKDWDKSSFEKLNSYLSDKPDRIVYGLTDDGMDQLRIQQGLQYTGFPIISRESLTALGYAMHPGFSSWGADIDLFTVYNSIGRVCNLKSEVLAFHISPHTNTRESDDINQHVAHISTQRKGSTDINQDISKLKSYIYKKNPSGLPDTQKHPEMKAQKIPAVETKNSVVKSSNTVVKANNPVVDRYIKRISSIKRGK